MRKFLCLSALLTLAACGEEPDAKAASTQASGAGAGPQQSAELSIEDRGRQQFNECAICHSVKQGDPNRVGPNLFNTYGRPAGEVEGFAYSKAVTESGIVWDDATLDGYLENPQMFLRGNRMAYAGQRDPEKRAALIAYIKTLKPAAE